MLMDFFREQKYWRECCEVEISNYKLSSCVLISLGLQKWQINFVLMATSSRVAHFSFHCARTEVGGVPRGPWGRVAVPAWSPGLALASTQFR